MKFKVLTIPFGNKKTQKYGKEILDMLTAFYERQTIKPA